MDRLLVIKKRAIEIGRATAFFWVVAAFISLQHFIIITFSALLLQWQRAPSGFDYTRLAAAVGIAMFITGVVLWVAWELMPASWKERLEGHFPSKRRG